MQERVVIFWVLVSMAVATLVFLTVMAIIETKKNRSLEVEQRIRRRKEIQFVAQRHNEICLALIREKERKGRRKEEEIAAVRREWHDVEMDIIRRQEEQREKQERNEQRIRNSKIGRCRRRVKR